uniref:Cyclin dependent kinase 18 n=1 Tax=Piliocolobus tephrosceles TaxID=591936 RepID=A0A8C9IJZ0_9PRIM
KTLAGAGHFPSSSSSSSLLFPTFLHSLPSPPLLPPPPPAQVAASLGNCSPFRSRGSCPVPGRGPQQGAGHGTQPGGTPAVAGGSGRTAAPRTRAVSPAGGAPARKGRSEEGAPRRRVYGAKDLAARSLMIMNKMKNFKRRFSLSVPRTETIEESLAEFTEQFNQLHNRRNEGERSGSTQHLSHLPDTPQAPPFPPCPPLPHWP